MTGQELYDALKDALRLFGLRFNEMDQVTVTTANDQVTFTFGLRSVTFGVSK